MKIPLISFSSGADYACCLSRLFYAFFTLCLFGLSASGTTLNPVADAYVRSGANADNNYGGSSSLEVRANSSAWRTTFLKFDISGISGTVTNATLRICANTSGSTQTTGVFTVADTSWTETGITWNNQPSIGSLLDEVEIDTSSYAWYELDVTSYIASEVSASSSLVTLCLDNTDDAVAVNKVRSKEASYTQWPELVITVSTAVAPSISSHPSDLTLDYGDTAAFSVTATGSPSPTYQWRKDGVNLSGAVLSTLSLPNAQEEDAGDYDVVVTNSAGSITSDEATLDFNPPVLPIIDEDFSADAANFNEVYGGTWSVSSGRYVLTSPGTAGNGLLGNISVHETVMTGDYSISSVINATGTGSAWNDVALVFGYQDEDNYYYVSLNESNDSYTKGLFKVVNGSPTELVDLGSLSISSDTDYSIDVERTGSGIVVDLNSSQVASTTDSTFDGGQVGYGSKNDGGQFDDLIVYGEMGASQVDALTFSLSGGTYSSSQSVTISTATSGASIRYTTDGSTPTSSYGTVYSGAVSISSTTTLRAIAYKSGMTNSAVNSATYTIITGTVANPQFSPGGGTYTSSQSVSISSSTSGAAIRYTTDGSTPTSSTGTVYSSAISVSSTTTLKAIAYKSGMTDSSVSTAVYTISGGGGPAKPSTANTGYSGSLTASGGLTITTNGAVVENLDISGSVKIQANNVTIRNCRIQTSGYYGIQCTYGYTGILIENCEISGVLSAAIYGGNFTARACYIHDSGADGIKPTGNYVIETCYFTDLGYISTAHADGVQMVAGSDGLIRWNTFDMIAGEDGYKNSQCMIIQTNNGPIDNIVIDGNWINGGGYSIQIRDKGNGYGVPTNIQIINNQFGTDAEFGIIIADGNPTISGNIWEATGEPAP